MNQQQNSGPTAPGRRDFGSASPANSPILGASNPSGSSPEHSASIARSTGIDRYDGSHPELPQRMISRRDETVRAGEHHYRSRPFETHENSQRQNDNTLPIIAGSLAGGVALAVLFAAMTQSHRREHNRKNEDRLPTQRRWSGDETLEAPRPSSAHGSSENRSIATEETWSLIASDKVEGTAVYDSGGEKLGSVYNFMVNKRSGYVAYAVMSFGGWLGMGERYHPLPWSTLTYDTDLSGYRVSVSKDRLRNAPSYEAGHDVSSDETYLRRLKEYWA
jgi:hypothetical protein